MVLHCFRDHVGWAVPAGQYELACSSLTNFSVARIELEHAVLAIWMCTSGDSRRRREGLGNLFVVAGQFRLSAGSTAVSSGRRCCPDGTGRPSNGRLRHRSCSWPGSPLRRLRRSAERSARGHLGLAAGEQFRIAAVLGVEAEIRHGLAVGFPRVMRITPSVV